MISCQKCEFKVPPKMRFALVKNFCPSCGASLLSDIDAQEIAGISKRLLGQEFMISLAAQLSKELIQNLTYDLSIYIKFNLQKELDNNAAEEAAANLISEEDIRQDSEKPKRIISPISRAGSSSPLKSQRMLPNDLDDGTMDQESSDDYNEEIDEEVLAAMDEPDDRVSRLKKVAAISGHKAFSGIPRSNG